MSILQLILANTSSFCFEQKLLQETEMQEDKLTVEDLIILNERAKTLRLREELVKEMKVITIVTLFFSTEVMEELKAVMLDFQSKLTLTCSFIRQASIHYFPTDKSYSIVYGKVRLLSICWYENGKKFRFHWELMFWEEEDVLDDIFIQMY